MGYRFATMALGSRTQLHKSKHPRYRWYVSFKEDGKVKRKHFRTRKLAEDWQEEREEENEEHGVGTTLSAAERSAVADHRDKLAELGLSVREALAMSIERVSAMQRSCTVAELVDSLRGEKEAEGTSDRYQEDLKSRLGRFRQKFGERNAASIEAQEITDWLSSLGKASATVANYRRVVGTLFAHGRKLGFCQTNPAEAALKPKVVHGEIGILSPAEARKLLAACDAEILPVVAIGIFSGVRDAELKRLQWRDVDLEGGFVTVTADKAKSARRRLIPIREALAAWLAPYALKRGNVWPVNGRKLLDAAKVAAGFGTPAMAAAAEVAPDSLQPWPQNAARHSFASYALASEQDAPKVALELGHTDTAIVFQHYRELVKPAEAKRFWAIRPPKRHGKILQMASA